MKQSNSQIPQQKQSTDSDETKLLKQSLINSLKSDFLENKYNKICAIYEDDDDMDQTKQIKSPKVNESMNNTNSFKLDKNVHSKKQEKKISNTQFQKSKSHRASLSLSNKNHINQAPNNDVESKPMNTLANNIQQLTDNDNDNIDDKAKIPNHEHQTSSVKYPVNKNRFQYGLSQTLSRQQSRAKQDNSSVQKLTLKNLLESSKGQLLNLNQHINSQQPFSQTYSQQMYSNRQDANSRSIKNLNHSQSLHKLQSPKQSSFDISQHNNFNNHSNHSNLNNGKLFPFSTRNSIATPFNELEKQYIGNFGRKDSDNLSLQLQQNLKKNENSQSVTSKGFKSQKNKLSSMLLSQKQINDIEEIRKNKKSDFYIQMNSFENQSPLEPKKTIYDIERSVAQNKYVSEFNTNTSAPTNTNNHAFTQYSNSKKSVQSSSKNIQEQQNKLHHKTLSNFSQAFNQQITSFIANDVEAIDGIVHKQPQMITPQNLSFYKNNNLAVAQMIQQKQQNQGQYKINEYMSKRKEIESIKKWMVQSLDNIAKQNTSLHTLFTQQQLIFHACISELLRQISLECKDRADLIQTIWNNHVEVATKVVEFYSKENNKVEWDTLNQIKSLHMRYKDELQLSQKYYEENNNRYLTNKNQLEIILGKYRMEKKLNKKLQKLCNQLKNDKQTINNLYCETSKEYIQAMINTGKLPQEQEKYLLQQYVEATKGLLSRKLDFKGIKESIQVNCQENVLSQHLISFYKLRDYTQKQSEVFVQQVISGKTPADSDDSADDDEEIKQMFQKRRIRFEEKATQVEEIKKVSQETETEHNKFMTSKGVQVVLNPKKSVEMQTENQVLEQQTQTDPKQLKNQYIQTDMTATNGEDFEKLKTVYLKKFKVDPTSNKQLEVDGVTSEEFDSNLLSYADQKDFKKTSLDELYVPVQNTNKQQGSGSKKQSLKKSRVSIFSMSSLIKSPSQVALNEIEESIPEVKIEENQENDYDFESQKKLKIFLKKIQDYTKIVKIDSRNPKQNITSFVEVTRETLKQFESLSSEIKQRLEQHQTKQVNLQINLVEKAMESDELKNLLLTKDEQLDQLLKEQKKINQLVDELDVSTDEELTSATPSAKLILNSIHEGRPKNNSSSSFGTIQIKEPFQHHQNVQNMINENASQANKANQVKKKASLILNMLHNQKDIASPVHQPQQAPSFSNMNESLKAKNLTQQRRQSQMVTQLFNLASMPVQNNQTNISQGYGLSIDHKKYNESKKSLLKIKNIMKSSNAGLMLNSNSLNLEFLVKQNIQDSETLQVIEQLQQQSNKIQTFHQETIAHKNTVIQIRKVLQSIYFEFIQNLKKGQKLNKPFCILLRDYFTASSTEQKTTSISKIKKIAEKCQIIPKSYEEIQMFNSLLGICRSNQEFYDQPEYLNIYLQMLYYLTEENQQSNSQIQIIHSQLKTNTTLIYKYLPSILSTYLPDKKIYDIVMYLLKPYISENEITDRDNLVDIPEPEEQELQFIVIYQNDFIFLSKFFLNKQDILSYVLNQFKDHSLFIQKYYNPIFDSITLNEQEKLTEEQFIFIQKHFGFSDHNKSVQNLFKFKEASAKQQMDKQTFVGFCNKNQIIDDFKFKHIAENNQYDDLTNFDFDIIEKLENIWSKQKQNIQKTFFESQAYKYIHRRLIMSIDSFIGISKKNPQLRKYYKARSFLAYKLLKMEIRLLIEEQYIKNFCVPEQLLLINKMIQPVLVNSQIKQISRKQKVLKKAVSIVYKNAFHDKKKNESSDQSDSQDSSSSQNSQMSSKNFLNNASSRQSQEIQMQNKQS